MQKDIDYIPQDDEIEELRQRILAAKDTEEESLRHANEELMTHFIYNSVNIAGDRVSRVNTMRTLKNIDSLADPTLKVALEILGLRDAYNKMLTIAEQPAIQTQDVADMHRLFYRRIDETAAGLIRPDTERRNYEAELNDFLQWLNDNHNTECFHTAATAYRRYIYMHPFKGGNGHLARLILALTMHKYRYPAIVIPNKWKAEYDTLIKNYDEDAFADFEAEDGDMILSADDFTTFESGGWGAMGDLVEMTPGHGYMYYSASDEVKYLVIQTGM
jgi:Fic family protein